MMEFLTPHGPSCVVTLYTLYGRYGDNTEIVYLLLAHDDTDINAKDDDGMTAYCAAISHGHTEIQNMFEEVAGDKIDKDCPSILGPSDFIE